MTMPPPPPGQGPIDPTGAFARPPLPNLFPPMSGLPAMPPMFYPSPPRGGGFAKAILTTLATSIFGFSILLNIYLLFASGILGSGDSMHETVVQNGSSSQRIVSVQINGLIDDAAADRLEKILRAESDDSQIKALVLEVDSPGGAVTSSDQMYADVKRFKDAKHIPVVVAMGSLAASGGYYISCAADKIVAQRSTLTGSIGVLMPRYDLSQLGEKYGVYDDSIHSTGADFKLAGSPLKQLTPPERQYFTALLDEMFATFKDVVKQGRGNRLKQPIEQLAVGKVFSGEEALKMGLVDQTGYASDAYAAAAGLASLGNGFEVVRVEPTPSFLGALSGSQSKFTGESRAQVQNGLNVNFDGSALQSLLSSRPMYLWTAR